jgi:phosphoenolpyruvate synthase/pyruvate phosphate dikinase
LERLRKDKTDISEEKRKELIKKIFSLFTSMCAYGLIGPIIEGGYGGVTKKLEEIFNNKTKNIKKVNEYISLLSYPYEESFDQKGQKELAKIAQKIYESEKLKVLFFKESEEVEKQLPREIKKGIEEYIFNWGWLTYSYTGPDYTILSAINDIKGMLSLEIPPKEQTKEVQKEIRRNQKKQRQALRELNLGKKELYIIKVAQNFTTTKYLRAKMMFLADFTTNNLLEFFVRKEGLSMKQMGACTVREILKYFETGKLPPLDILNKRLKYCILITKPGGEEILLGAEAKKWVDKNIDIEEISKDISEIYGQVACVGEREIIKGVVKIVNVGQEMEKFNEGDILVSLATTPEIVPVMKKAGAIITDIGGLTCHAAIVSRELKKPCIIGAKIATKVLKDGDLVEVDANSGIVRTLSKR